MHLLPYLICDWQIKYLDPKYLERQIWTNNVDPVLYGFTLFAIPSVSFGRISWARSCENVSCAICKQQRRRSACPSAQSDSAPLLFAALIV